MAIEIPIITPWMIQVFTILIMGFVMIKILKIFEKKLGFKIMDLFNFKQNKLDSKKRQLDKLKKEADNLADSLRIDTLIEDEKNNIKRYKAEKEKNKK